MALRLRKSGMLSMVYRAPPGLNKDTNKRNLLNPTNKVLMEKELNMIGWKQS